MTSNEDQAAISFASATGSTSADEGHDSLYENNTGRSNFVAFLLGGVVISGGLLAFLYYDSDNLASRDLMTTGSLGRIEMPAARTTPPPAALAPSTSR